MARKKRLRCFAERRNGHWIAFCLELNLAAQDSSLTAVRKRIDGMVQSYLDDALKGEDRQHASDLLNRPAPLEIWLRYYFLSARHWLRKVTNRNGGARPEKFFHEVMPANLGRC